MTADVNAGPDTGARPRRTDDLIDQSRRASRIEAVRAEKALHLATTYEKRARRGVHNSVLYLAQARRLREAAVDHVVAARRHAETVEALTAWPRTT